MPERKLQRIRALNCIPRCEVEKKAIAEESMKCSSWMCVFRKNSNEFGMRSGMTVHSRTEGKRILVLVTMKVGVLLELVL